MDKQRYFHPAAIVLLLCSIAVSFLPGTSSDFIFDDFPNLEALAHIKGEAPFSAGFMEFVLGGEAGPTGRPVSLLTFALQAEAWPDNPGAFKRVNLLIHALNAVLVYLFSCQLGRVFGLGLREKIGLALFSSLLWALHPMHSGLVLYAVQRMALLSGFFMLISLCSYLHFRLQDFSARPSRQLGWLTLALACPGLLALFSKENAASLVFFLLVLEYTVLNNVPASPLLVKWRRLFLWGPALATILLPLFFLGALQDDFATLYAYGPLERLLSQGRILWQYFSVLLLPSASSVGLFHDVQPSTGLLSPLSTLPALLGWLALLALALWKPGKHNLALFALLWFFSAHVVESTILPLELYFNHRNYLAFLGLIIAATYTLLNLVPAAVLSLRLRAAVAVLYAMILAFQSVNTSMLWRDPLALSAYWYRADPATSRNAEFHAISLAQYDLPGLREAAGIYENAFASDPGNFRLLLNRMLISCSSASIQRPSDELILQGLSEINPENRDLVSPVQQLVTLAVSNQCSLYSDALLTTLLQALMDNADSVTRGHYQFELARLTASRGNTQESIRLLELSYSNTGDPGALFTLALRLINSNRYQEALEVIDRAINRLQEYNNIRTGTRETKLAVLYEMRTDVLGFINRSTSQDVP